MPGYVHDDINDEELERQKSLYGPFTQAVRELVDATIRTTVDDDEIRAVQKEVEALTARLRASQLAGPYGVRFGSTGRGRPWGNTVVGVRNACAPPLVVEHDPRANGDVWADFHLGAAYEGPPSMVHGGVTAMVLDQMLGEAASAGGKPGMTGTLTIRYRRGTPLGDLRAEAWIDRVEGIKTYAMGHLKDEEGVTVEAEGIFILPRWAREAVEPPSYYE
jgi:acyl-coenzyme A thioesterase PaaI-like protein